MMRMMIYSLLILQLARFADAGIYEIRTTARQLEDAAPSASPLISFDGDLDRIKELALERASRNPSEGIVTPTKSPTLSYAPTQATAYVPISCDGVVEHLEIVTWKYSMETVPDAVVPTVYGEVQEITLEKVAPRSLWCKNEDAAFGNIVTMDAEVLSEQLDEPCDPVLDDTYKCTVVRGRLRLFLSKSDSADDAISIVLQNIEEAYNDPDFARQVNTGLMRITFLFENSDSTEAPIRAGSEKDATGNVGGGGATSVPSFVLVAVGSAALVVFVGSIYYWRRRTHGHNEEGAATQMAGVSFSFANESLSADATSTRPTSPFSEMVPDAYRLGDNISILSTTQGMSPVYENDDSTTSGSIVVSESGYTTEAGRSDAGDSLTTMGAIAPKSVYSTTGDKTSDFLGARPRPGTMIRDIEMEEDGSSESELDTSGEMSPVKHFVNNLLVPPGNEPDESGLADDMALLFEESATPKVNVVDPPGEISPVTQAVDNLDMPKGNEPPDASALLFEDAKTPKATAEDTHKFKSPESDIKTVDEQQQQQEAGDFEDVDLGKQP